MEVKFPAFYHLNKPKQAVPLAKTCMTSVISAPLIGKKNANSAELISGKWVPIMKPDWFSSG